ncbi:MAG: hypothetical protein Q4P33_09085 [Flaviflexus sp.]|nr:hypothetical protein [Flaviflexus sp.]
MEAPTSSLLAIAPDGIAQATSRDDAAALIAPALSRAVWPDGRVGTMMGDIVIVSQKFLARCHGFVRSGTEGAMSEENLPAGLAVLPLADPRAEARELRRALDARLGGRPGVIITGRVAAAGVDRELAGRNLREDLAALAETLFNTHPNHPVVLVRGLGHLLTYEDQD